MLWFIIIYTNFQIIIYKTSIGVYVKMIVAIIQTHNWSAQLITFKHAILKYHEQK